MKKNLKNINIPFREYSKKDLRNYYIYNNKKYSDINLLFIDYIGSYLTYHFKINNEIKEVYNLNDIANYLLEDYQTFEIPDEYKDEYTSQEYKYFYYMKNNLLNDNIEKDESRDRPMKLKEIFRYPVDYLVFFELKKYKDVSIPKKVYSKILKRYVYVLYGEFFENASYTLDELFGGIFYYQFSGDGIKDSYKHNHEHDFESVIKKIFTTFDEFKIYDFQKQYFSKQELDFIIKLLEKLKKDNFTSIYYKKENEYLEKAAEEYACLKCNKKYIKLLIFNIRDYFNFKKCENDIINSHKTK